MFGGSLPMPPYNYRRHPKPTKKNIKQLIEDQKKVTFSIKKQKILDAKREFQLLVARDLNLTQTIVSISQESHVLWHDLQDINQGRLQGTRLRNLKAQITQVLEECLSSGTIVNLRALANLNDHELTIFLRELNRHRDGFNRENVEKIPFFLYKAKQDNDNQDPCSICHQNYEEGVECIRLQCRHVFHRKCISTWLRLKKNCPLCKTNVTINNIPNPSEANNNPISSNNDQNARQNRD